MLVLFTLLAASSPSLVELYTSEGCSSCPPADALFGQIVTGSVLGVSLHVDYWNDLGWTDPYSLAAATDRQQEYARIAQQRTYTPQVVVDGRYTCVGADQACIAAALARTPQKAPLALQCAHGSVTVSATPPLEGRLTVAVVTKAAGGTVSTGENKGKTLNHSWVARKLHTKTDWRGAAVSFPVPADRAIAFVQNRSLEVIAIGSCDL